MNETNYKYIMHNQDLGSSYLYQTIWNDYENKTNKRL